MNRHTGLVADISAAVRQFYDRRVPFRIFHGSTNSTRHNVTQKQHIVDTSKLCNVLQVDTARKTALVEPNVPMDRLVATTLKYGLVPPVVMEFPGITAGGGYAGTAGESSSFKHGYFDKTINWVEIVLGNGEVVRASQSDKEDLFQGAAGAVGTLGITTLMELQLIEAKPFVRATYHPVTDINGALATIKDLINQPNIDYVDGIMFSKSLGAIVSGQMVSSPDSPGRIQYFSRPWDPWFYLHVQDSINRGHGQSVTETIPLAEYLFRYDRGGFWVGAAAFKYFNFIPFNRLTRWFLDDFLHTRVLYRALHASRQSMRFVVQDVAMPFESAPDFVDYTHHLFGIYPLWLCPLRQSAAPTFHPHNTQQAKNKDGSLAPLINIGLWGDGPKNHEDFVTLNRDLEDKLRILGGTKWFYAQSYYTEDEFWQIYDKKWYEALRTKYHATYLPTVHQKISVDVNRDRKELQSNWRLRLLRVWPFAGLWGICKAIVSGDWTLPKSTRLAALTVAETK
jgi:FAD/FMN-containing dehydrogenase